MPSSFIFMLLLLYVHVSSCFLPKVLPGSSYSSWSFPCRLGAQHNTLNAALPTWNCHPKDCLHLPHHRGQQSYIKNTVGKPRNHSFFLFILVCCPHLCSFCSFLMLTLSVPHVFSLSRMESSLNFSDVGQVVFTQWSWPKRHDIFVMTMTWG